MGSAGCQDVCFGCHSVQGMQKIKDGKTISLQIEQERFEPSVHGAFECTACHSDGALFWHLAGIVMSQQRRQRLKEQTLRWKDFPGAWQMTRYHLGFEPRPPYTGEFNYAEKVEYWAFMWAWSS
jgi:hypothetical protein